MDLIRDYRAALEEARTNQADAMADGSCGSFDDYRFRVGVRRGLLHAAQLFDDAVKKSLDESDDF